MLRAGVSMLLSWFPDGEQISEFTPGLEVVVDHVYRAMRAAELESDVELSGVERIFISGLPPL